MRVSANGGDKLLRRLRAFARLLSKFTQSLSIVGFDTMQFQRSVVDDIEKQLRSAHPRLQVVIGPRQVGKSTSGLELYSKGVIRKKGSSPSI